MQNHWCLAAINLRRKRFEYYDSLGGTNNECLMALRKWLQDEHKDKKGSDMDLTEWTFHTPGDNVPQQKNGYDCGVFMCKYADFVAKDQPLAFGQDQMQYFRKRLALDTLNKTYSI